MVAVCDESLIDKILEEGELVMDIKNYSDFYKGNLIPSKELAELITRESVASANIVGKEAVDIAIETKLIEKGHIRKIKGVPYAQAYRVDF
jgi:hypothetical protein